MVANRNQPGRLLALDLVQTHRALRPHHQLLPGDPRQLLQVRRRQPLHLSRHHRLRSVVVPVRIVASMPQEAEVDDEDRAHAGARQEHSKENGENHAVTYGFLFFFQRKV
ncbi:hypothetical protein ACOSQ2_014441 [Xanthoceras sorbifolium]